MLPKKFSVYDWAFWPNITYYRDHNLLLERLEKKQKPISHCPGATVHPAIVSLPLPPRHFPPSTISLPLSPVTISLPLSPTTAPPPPSHKHTHHYLLAIAPLSLPPSHWPPCITLATSLLLQYPPLQPPSLPPHITQTLQKSINTFLKRFPKKPRLGNDMHLWRQLVTLSQTPWLAS